MNFKRKLTSRKFWMAVTGFVTAIMLAFNVDNMTIEKAIAVVSASATLIAYIVGEGLVDSARERSKYGK